MLTYLERYAESIGIFYSVNTFQFAHRNGTTLDLYHWTKSVLKQRLSFITSLDFVWCNDNPESSPETKAAYNNTWTFLQQLSSLQRLQVTLHPAYF
jgi:hypothetical protein